MRALARGVVLQPTLEHGFTRPSLHLDNIFTAIAAQIAVTAVRSRNDREKHRDFTDALGGDTDPQLLAEAPLSREGFGGNLEFA